MVGLLAEFLQAESQVESLAGFLQVMRLVRQQVKVQLTKFPLAESQVGPLVRFRPVK